MTGYLRPDIYGQIAIYLQLDYQKLSARYLCLDKHPYLHLIFYGQIFSYLQPDVYSQMTRYLQPDLNSQGVHEAEEPGGLPAGDLEEDGDAQVHEGLHRRQHMFLQCPPTGI